MMRQKIVDIKFSGDLNGQVLVRRVSAGVRTKCVIEAEIPGVGLKNTLLNSLMLPHCIVQTPWLMRKMDECLFALDPQDYDALIDAMRDVMKPYEDEAELKKKSNPPSSPMEQHSQNPQA